VSIAVGDIVRARHWWFWAPSRTGAIVAQGDPGEKMGPAWAIAADITPHFMCIISRLGAPDLGDFQMTKVD